MEKETERLNNWVGWYKHKLKEIDEAPVDSRLRMLERLYRVSEKNKNCGVMITRAGTLNPVNYPGYPPELKLPEDNNEEKPYYYAPKRVHCLMDVNHIIKLIISGRSLKLIRVEIKMQLNMLRKLRN